MSHLTYVIGALAEDLAQRRRRGGRRPRAGPCRGRAAGGSRSARGRGCRWPSPGAPDTGRCPALTISGSIQRPNPRPRSTIRRRQPVEPVRQLAPVDDPVAERAVVGVALAEPAVVEDEQLDAEVLGRDAAMATRRSASKSKYVASQLLRRTGRGRSRQLPAGEAAAVQVVEGVAHRAEAVGRPDDDRLRRRERRARFEAPGERLGLDAEAQPASSRTGRPRPRPGSCPSRRGCSR